MEKVINKDIGLKSGMISLSPAFKICIKVEYFSLDRKEPKSSDLLKMYVRGELIKEHFF